MNGRIVAQRFLVGESVAAAGENAYDLASSTIQPNDLVFYNPRTGATLGPGITYATNPDLAIAQAVDFDGNGLVDALRPVFGNYLVGEQVWNVTTEGPTPGVNKIVDAFWKCTYKDTSYSLNVEWRNDDTLDTNLWNQYSYKTLSVEVGDYLCDSCDDGVDCGAVACAMANQFYQKNLTSSDSIFLHRAAKVAKAADGVDVYPILNKEVQYCISLSTDACDNCNLMDAVKSVTIVADPAILDADGAAVIGSDVVVQIVGSGIPGDATKSYYGTKNSLVDQLNAAFKANGITAHAVVVEAVTGGAKPCTDFKILINSCFTITLQDSTDADITPCVAEYNPYTGLSFTNEAECVGCTPNSSFVPNCGVRVVAKPLEVKKTDTQKFDPKAWYHTDTRITIEEHSKWRTWKTRVFQDIQPPINMGMQFSTMMLMQNATGQGFNYISGTHDMRNLYQSNEAAELKYNTIGLNFNGLYRSVTFSHGLPWNTTHSNDVGSIAKGQTFILIEESNTTAKTDVAAILDPWLASLPRPKGALDMSADTQEDSGDATGAS